MTAVGKILVFLNLVFSFVVGAFAVMDYTARTHYAEQNVKLRASLQASQAAGQVYKDEAERLGKDRAVMEKGLSELGGGRKLVVEKDKEGKEKAVDPARVVEATLKAMERQKEENDALRKQLETAKENAAAFNKENEKYKAASVTLQKDVERRDADNRAVRAALNAETDRNIKLVKDMNKVRDEKTEEMLKAQTFEGRNRGLVKQVEDLEIALARAKSPARTATGALAAGGGVNPPPDQVEGLIQRIEGNLVTLTIGSDAGLLKGHTMEVFGLTGVSSGYRGKIKLVDVQAKSAVAELHGKQSGKIRVGDTVASTIMGGRQR